MIVVIMIKYLIFMGLKSNTIEFLCMSSIFKIRTLENNHRTIKNYSFFASRTEVMANRNLLKLSVIPSAKSQTIDPIFFMQLETNI